jgi:hypothetical protein
MNDDILKIIESGDRNDFRAWLAKYADTPENVRPGEATLAQKAYYRGCRDWAPELAQRLTEDDFGTSCTLGDLHRVTLQIEANPAIVNELSNDGFVPLCLAAAFGHEQMVDLLINCDAHPNAQSQSLGGVRPLDSAIFGRSQSIIHKLLEAGADPNLAQAGGFYPIHGAAQNGNLEVVKDLVAHGAKTSAVTDDGKTASGLGGAHPHIVDYFAAF